MLARLDICWFVLRFVRLSMKWKGPRMIYKHQIVRRTQHTTAESEKGQTKKFNLLSERSNIYFQSYGECQLPILDDLLWRTNVNLISFCWRVLRMFSSHFWFPAEIASFSEATNTWKLAIKTPEQEFNTWDEKLKSHHLFDEKCVL